jgi:hypothetical protein
MRIARKSVGFSMAGSILASGCGGRSDMPEYYAEVASQGGFGGTTTITSSGGKPTTASGGTTVTSGPTSGGYVTANGGFVTRGGAVGSGGIVGKGGALPSGGVMAKGGAVASGGTVSSGGIIGKGGTTGKGGTAPVGGSGGAAAAGGKAAGGTSGASTKGSCCSVHASTGCSNATIEQCVCRSDAVCCSVGWDDVCIKQVTDFGCGTCSAGGAGGTTSAGGGVSAKGGSTFVAGGAFPTGGATVQAGAPATGGSAGAAGIAANGGDPGLGGSPTTGGIPATGGFAATGGAPATGGAAAALALIDNLEDGDGNIIPIDGRQGYWYTFNDGTMTGTQQPVWGGRILNAQPIFDRPDSKFAAWTLGSGFTNWGFGIGVFLNGPSSFYNASKYRGVTFWARLGSSSANVVRVDVSDSQTVSYVGGICSSCWDYFGKNFIMSTSWQRYSFAWSDLTQQGWGDQFPAIFPAAIREMRFATQATGITFEIYVDDLSFIP